MLTQNVKISKKQSARVDSLLGLISPKRALDKKQWYAICIAMKNAGGSYGAFEQWSLTGKYSQNFEQIKRAWENLRGGYSLGTLIHYAKLDNKKVDLSGLPRIPKKTSIPPASVSSKSPPAVTPLIPDGPKHFQILIKDYINIATEERLMAMSPVAIDPNANPRQIVIDLLASLYDYGDQVFIGDAIPNNYSWKAMKDPEEREKCKLEYQRNHLKTVAEWFTYFCDYRQDHCLKYIRPNTLSGEETTGIDGRKSLVSDACVAKFKFAVVEFDNKSIQEQIAFWLYMIDHKMDIAALIHSGGKSIHGWLAVDCKDQEEWTKDVERHLFDQILHPLGADRACKNESRLSRLPGVSYLENNQIRNQRLLYLNNNYNIKDNK